jgi:hypothetical protein
VKNRSLDLALIETSRDSGFLRAHLQVVIGNSPLAHVGQVSGLPVHASSAGISFSAAEPPETGRPEAPQM